MIEKLETLGNQALKEIQDQGSLEGLEASRIQYLGKKGALSEVLKGLGQVAASERPAIGAAANEWKRKIEALLETRKEQLERAALDARLKAEALDITLPARQAHRGSTHVITQTTQRILDVFMRLGFDVVTGPEVDTEFLNFDAVNIPADHPAREMQDTFFMGPGVVLRTHTSSVQMRAMRSQRWPVRVVCPGAVYRCDNDATHSPMFHQIEGLWVDRGVRMSDLKGVLGFMARELFGRETKVRLRPSYFPFVEPGAEVDVSCFQCRKKADPQCKICKGSGWVEILGAGMVHPRLLETAGYGADREREGLTGFAFGVGIERVAMLLYEIPDMRLLFQNDIRFLSQFRK
jgi:phenylalanyl-tRNA synthetase alpha chain